MPNGSRFADPSGSSSASGTPAAAVLVVDDSRVSRRKLSLAVRSLGHEVDEAADGQAALELLRSRSFDAILLDIVMPEMDGYAVLRALKADTVLRELPVIVVSSLDDEIGSVVKAIELGAVDFLPKEFEPAILKARLDASLARKRLRDRELADLRDVEQLTRAAEVIEAGPFRPWELDIDKVATRRDSLGQLASVFRGLAEEIYERERRLYLRIRTLRGMLLVIAVGAAGGLIPALGRMGVGLGAPPLGLAVWANIVSAIFCFAVAAARTGLPRFRFAHLPFFLLWAIVVGISHRLATFVIAEHVEASMISLIGSSRGFMVFGLAALIALERPSLRRLGGLGLGFAAVAAVLLTRQSDDGENASLWLIAALVLPLLLSVHTLLMTLRPRELDAFATVGVMMTLSAAILAPAAFASGDLAWPTSSSSQLALIVLVLGIASAIGLALALDLVALAGAVFASQTAYSQTIAGVLWGMLLLGEELSPVAWLALALVVIALWLVEPKRAGNEFAVTLSLARDDAKAELARRP